MFYVLITLLVIAVGSPLWFLFARRRRAFLVVVEKGNARVLLGDVRDDYVVDVQRLCKLWNITDCEVRGIKGPRGIRIEVTGDIATDVRRAFQNAWDHPL